MSRLTVRKSFELRGEEHEVFFREMSVADTQKLLRGQRAAVGDDGKLRAELDYGAEYDRSLLQVQLSMCTDDTGKERKYSNIQQLQNLPQALVAQYIKYAKEAEKEFADTSGN